MSNPIDELKAGTALRHHEALALLARMVNTDSGSYSRDGISLVQDLVAGELAGLGFAASRHPHEKYGETVVARRQGSGGLRVLLIGHVDTVYPPEAVKERPFTIEGARALGPGVADDKGGVVTMLEGLRALHGVSFTGFGTITALINADEEIGSLGSRPLIEEAARQADVAFVLEPGRPDGSLVTRRKGVGMFTVTVHGRAAHAGAFPEKGASAVVEMAHKVLALARMNDHARGVTVNPGVVQGGTRSNVIPDHAVIRVDVRIPTAADGKRVVKAVQRLAQRTKVPGTSVEVEGGINRPPMEKSEAGERLLRVVYDVGARLGITLAETSSGGGSDGNFVAAQGVPVVDAMGAVGGNFHSPEEYLEVPTLPARAALLAGAIWAACQPAAWRA